MAANWVINFVVAQSFTMLAGNQFLNKAFHGAFSMWLFAFLYLASMAFVLRFVPETRGVSLEKIEPCMMGSPDPVRQRSTSQPLTISPFNRA